MKINIGSGGKKLDGFVNIDYDPQLNPDILMNLETDCFPFDDSVVTEVLAHHVLEHIGPGYLKLIKEIYRICCNNAKIDILVPYFRHENFYSDPTHIRPITHKGLMLFSKSYNDLCRLKNNPSSSLAYFLNVDFVVKNVKYFLDARYAKESDILIKSGKFDKILACNDYIEDMHVELVCLK